MATVQIIVVNPTDADVTSTSGTAKARSATKLAMSDAATDAFVYLAAKCALVSQSAGVATDFEKNGFLMDRLARYA